MGKPVNSAMYKKKEEEKKNSLVFAKIYWHIFLHNHHAERNSFTLQSASGPSERTPHPAMVNVTGGMLSADPTVPVVAARPS